MHRNGLFENGIFSVLMSWSDPIMLYIASIMLRSVIFSLVIILSEIKVTLFLHKQ